MTMPDPLVWLDQTKPQNLVLSHMELEAHATCSNSEWGYPGFSVEQGNNQLYSENKATLVNISREQGMNLILGDTECGDLAIVVIWKTLLGQ